MQKTCLQCSATFVVSDEDRAFYTKLSSSAPELHDIPPPTLCPDCRQQRRLARRNERTYHKRSCGLCGKEMITMYPPEQSDHSDRAGTAEAPFPVYCPGCWWSDTWDPLSFGRSFDPDRPFLEQFAALQSVVPRISLFGKNNENCEYVNHTVDSKNCYLCVDTRARDTFYSKWMIDCSDCCDCYQVEKSERCYESQYSVHLHGSVYAFLCYTSSALAFCYDCKDCHDCFLCAHLRNKRFCIANEQLTEDEYRKQMQEWDFGSFTTLQKALDRYHDLWKTTFHRAQQVISSEDCSGDFIDHCKNVHDSFGVIESQDCRYCYDAGFLEDCYDAYEPAFDCELQYDSHGCNGGKRLLGCHICYDNDALAYCDFCHNSSRLFGCISLRRKKHCILNTQYTQKEYEALLPQLIENMKLSGAWGEFFPVALSPFGYNESTAQEYYPLSKKDALHRKWPWRDRRDEPLAVEKVIPADRLPDSIDDIPDDILQWAVQCGATERPFRITRQELAFYRSMRLPIPRLHPDERHRLRMAFTNPRKLWDRACGKCGKAMKTTYPPDSPATVFCEQCYLSDVY
jgi:hypothetical protein